MNDVFGQVFQVSPVEMFEPAAFAQASVPRDLFVFDDRPGFSKSFSPSSIPPGGFLTVDETQLGFGFSSTGSEVIVLTHSEGAS